MLETKDKFDIVTESVKDNEAIKELTKLTFGPGLYAKTAEKIRQNSRFLNDLSYVAYQGPYLVGTVRIWDFYSQALFKKALFLGPIVVDESFHSLGIGKILIEKVISSAFKTDYEAIFLIGDLNYFSLFGFCKSPNNVTNYPVDPNRLLVRYLK